LSGIHLQPVQFGRLALRTSVQICLSIILLILKLTNKSYLWLKILSFKDFSGLQEKVLFVKNQ